MQASSGCHTPASHQCCMSASCHISTTLPPAPTLPSPPLPIPPSPQVRQLREALSSAQQRGTAAEAKVELLQEAVRKAEERAARLEMERSSRTQAAGEWLGGREGWGVAGQVGWLAGVRGAVEAGGE